MTAADLKAFVNVAGGKFLVIVAALTIAYLISEAREGTSF